MSGIAVGQVAKSGSPPQPRRWSHVLDNTLPTCAKAIDEVTCEIRVGLLCSWRRRPIAARVLGFGLLQDWDVGVGRFSKSGSGLGFLQEHNVRIEMSA
jgi:hypothetical protein